MAVVVLGPVCVATSEYSSIPKRESKCVYAEFSIFSTAGEAVSL